ncbi:MAG: hypothetical protein E5W70_06250 [Mesorhizobium sp.]|uniref:hypothetical protein n=1 Tax=Mesorhizobium sp. TaxID=1871066 RepID=UPI0011FD4CB6|nr:hypothetical protein [Mesorhizobium sp.]TIT23836.1 MAG: hypothetical protein E5W70_06250 [Mesorhizobium sp.]
MLTKILAASALTIGLATSAMAQNVGDPSGAAADGSGRTVVVPDNGGPDTSTDSTITNSIRDFSTTNSNADRNCPPGPQGALPDATGKAPGTMAPTVNDNHCGK